MLDESCQFNTPIKYISNYVLCLELPFYNTANDTSRNISIQINKVLSYYWKSIEISYIFPFQCCIKFDAKFLAYLMSNIVEIWLIIISSHFWTKYDGTAPNVKLRPSF